MFSATQDVQRLKLSEAQVRKREELQPVVAEPFLFFVVELSEMKSIDELVLYSLYIGEGQQRMPSNNDNANASCMTIANAIQ